MELAAVAQLRCSVLPLFDRGLPSSRPCRSLEPSRADAVKVGRRSESEAYATSIGRTLTVASTVARLKKVGQCERCRLGGSLRINPQTLFDRSNALKYVIYCFAVAEYVFYFLAQMVEL